MAFEFKGKTEEAPEEPAAQKAEFQKLYKDDATRQELIKALKEYAEDEGKKPEEVLGEYLDKQYLSIDDWDALYEIYEADRLRDFKIPMSGFFTANITLAQTTSPPPECKIEILAARNLKTHAVDYEKGALVESFDIIDNPTLEKDEDGNYVDTYDIGIFLNKVFEEWGDPSGRAGYPFLKSMDNRQFRANHGYRDVAFMEIAPKIPRRKEVMIASRVAREDMQPEVQANFDKPEGIDVAEADKDLDHEE